MTERYVNLVRGIYEAFAMGDIPAVIAALHTQIEWREAENFIDADGNPYIGPNAVLEGVFMRIGTEWDDFRISPAEFLDAGETIVAQGYYSGTYKKSGKKVRAQFAHFFRFRDGKVARFQQYTVVLSSRPSGARTKH